MSLQDTLGVQGVGLLLFAGLFLFCLLFSFSFSLRISFSSFAFSVFWYLLDCNPKSVDFEIFSFCLSSELYKELSNEKVLRVGSSSCSNCARS